MAGLAKTIALDVIAQMASQTVFLWSVPNYTAAYKRMYVDDLETMVPALAPTSVMAVVLAPIGGDTDRDGWGGDAVHCTVQIGMLLQILVANPENDAEMDPYEQFIDQMRLFLLSSRHFASVWDCVSAAPVLGDHYNSHLYEKSEFHVPFLLEFQYYGSAEGAGV